MAEGVPMPGTNDQTGFVSSQWRDVPAGRPAHGPLKNATGEIVGAFSPALPKPAPPSHAHTFVLTKLAADDFMLTVLREGQPVVCAKMGDDMLRKLVFQLQFCLENENVEVRL